MQMFEHKNLKGHFRPIKNVSRFYGPFGHPRKTRQPGFFTNYQDHEYSVHTLGKRKENKHVNETYVF